ncbi:MAG: hypothetical protein U9N30_05955, partial [Campylobacterota bacterium]|nr:hypothetical protein [Campylobacterota bacterium]
MKYLIIFCITTTFIFGMGVETLNYNKKGAYSYCQTLSFQIAQKNGIDVATFNQVCLSLIEYPFTYPHSPN